MTLKVYDMLGREVAVLVKEKKSPGTYKVTWNGRTSSSQLTSSGVYFYSLIIDGIYKETKKLVVLR